VITQRPQWGIRLAPMSSLSQLSICLSFICFAVSLLCTVAYSHLNKTSGLYRFSTLFVIHVCCNIRQHQKFYRYYWMQPYCQWIPFFLFYDFLFLDKFICYLMSLLIFHPLDKCIDCDCKLVMIFLLSTVSNSNKICSF